MVTFPENPDCEKLILATCITDSQSCVSEILESCSNPLDLFHDVRHKEIWNRIEKLYDAGEPINIKSVGEAKVEHPIPVHEYGALLDSAGFWADLNRALKTAREFAKKRKAVHIALTLLEGSQDKPIDDVLACAEQLLYSQTDSVETKTIKSAIQSVTDSWEWAHQNEGKLSGVPSGIYELDQLTWGFQNKNLVVVGARPSQGKSSICLQFCIHAALDQKKPTLLFTLEDSTEQVIRRIVCMRRRLDVTKLRAGKFTEGDMAAITTEFSNIQKSPLHVIDNGSLSILQIRSIARRYSRNHGIKLIVVDYLQKVKAPKSEKRTYEVGAVSEGLKEMAKELNCPVIAACQLNRESEKEKGRPPRSSDLGDSGMIERDADLIALLHRHPEQTNVDALRFNLLLGKHRDGPTGIVPLLFFPKTTRFENGTH